MIAKLETRKTPGGRLRRSDRAGARARFSAAYAATRGALPASAGSMPVKSMAMSMAPSSKMADPCDATRRVPAMTALSRRPEYPRLSVTARPGRHVRSFQRGPQRRYSVCFSPRAKASNHSRRRGTNRAFSIATLRSGPLDCDGGGLKAKGKAANIAAKPSGWAQECCADRSGDRGLPCT